MGTKVREDVTTIGELLSTQGYQTALIGKAHFQPLQSTNEHRSIEAYPTLQDLNFWKQFNESYYGFDHVELARNHTNEAHVGQHYALWLEEKGCKNWRDYFLPPTGTMDRSKRRTWDIPEEYHYDAWIAERTNAMLDEYADHGENFFLWSSFFDPHPDYFVPKPWDTMYDPTSLTLAEMVPGEHVANPPHFAMTQQERPDFSMYRESGFACHGMTSHLRDREELRKDLAAYYAMISLMDKYIGSILDRLDELGLSENTIVVFASDHGHLLGHHGLVAKGPFHYEDLIRVPLIVRYPGRVPGGKVSDAIQSLVDFSPTILSLTGNSIPGHMTGVDQSGVWTGREEFVRRHAICENHHEPTTINLRTYVDSRYKITVYYDQPYGELYDLQQDPGEIKNLWDDPGHRDLKLKLLMKYIWAELGKEPIWMPRIAGA